MAVLDSKRKKYLNKIAIQAFNKIQDREEAIGKSIIRQKIREKTTLSRHEYTGKIYLCPVCECLVSKLLVKFNWVGCKKCWEMY
jgi:hypothetical protein